METNVIYCGDNIEAMRRHIPDSSVDLIYADPPFFSNKQYEILWGNGYELRAFKDRWKGGINNYRAWMKPRLRECYRVLKKSGSMYLHCDWHANAHLRLLMDRIFGKNNFLREIIWSIETASGFKSQANMWIRGHDTLLFYKKGDDYVFNKQFYALDEKTIRRYDKVDGKGRRYKIYYEKGGKRKSGSVGKRLVYLDKSKGRPLTDVWTDIIGFQTVQKKGEYLGYPTQKPEALLERIIKASSNPMDIVLDPMCGGGTTIAVAHKLGRRWIGVDVSPTACKVMAKRMRKLGVSKVKVIGLPRTVEELKALQPFEFQNWVFEKLHGRVNPKKIGDMGIDGWIELDVPTQVKQSDNVGRNVVDNFETAIRRYGKKKGVIVAFGFTRPAKDEVARISLLNGMSKLDIRLKTVKEILKET